MRHSFPHNEDYIESLDFLYWSKAGFLPLPAEGVIEGPGKSEDLHHGLVVRSLSLSGVIRDYAELY